MSSSIREYLRPPDTGEALALLQRGEPASAPVNFGPRIPVEPYAGYQAAVDLSRLGLDYVELSSDHIRLGGQTPLQTLVESVALREVANGIVPEAAHLSAHPGLRRLATVSGTLQTPGSPLELSLALLVLDSLVVIQGMEEQETPLASYRPAEGEILIEVNFALPPAKCGGAIGRVARTPKDQAIVAAVALVTGQNARVAVAGASPAPLLRSLENDSLRVEQLRSLANTIEAEADPTGDYRGSAEYRRAMAGVLARRALETAWKRAKEQ